MSLLFKKTGFIPFIAMIFLNAFVDLGHKIIIQNTIFKIYDGSAQVILTAIVNALILLPFIILLTPSGALSDRFKKPNIMRWASLAATFLTLLITLSYYMGWFELAFAMTFMLAVQSAFYSPAKYGYIPEIAGKGNLAIANGLVQSVTIIAILLGMFVFSVFFETMLAKQSFNNEASLIRLIAPVGWLLVLGSLIEVYLAFCLPDYKKVTKASSFSWQRYLKGQLLKHNLSLLIADKTIWLSVIGLSIFWGVSQVVLATFPAYAKETFAIDNTVIIQGLLACSGLGIIIGSLFAGIISGKHIEKGLIVLGAIGMAITLYLLTALTSKTSLAINILAFGFFGGLFIVPLNALIQLYAKPHKLGTIIAGNNWLQNIVMTTFLTMTVIFSLTNMPSKTLLHLITLVAFVAALCTIWILAKHLIYYVVKIVFAMRYRIIAQGLSHIPTKGGVLMLGNHISWLDWAMLQIVSPRPIHFVMAKQYYRHRYLSWLLDLFGVIPIASHKSKGALKAVNHYLKQGEVVCLFPEGAISQNGQLGEFKRGFEHCIDGVKDIIIPFYLHGLWGSRFSLAGKHLQSLKKVRGRRTVIVAFGEPLAIKSSAFTVKNAVFDLSITAWQHTAKTLPTLAKAWIMRVKQQGQATCLTDIQSKQTLSRRQALVTALLFAQKLSQQNKAQNIGLLLPTSSAGLLMNMAALIKNKTVVNLNFSASIEAIRSAIRQADIHTIYTSRQFMQALAKKGMVLDEVFKQVSPIYLEDIKTSITPLAKLSALIASYLPTTLLLALFGHTSKMDKPAAILFSSGSEGNPKGVVLTQQNVMANIKQVSDVLAIQKEDVMVANLPLFHSFGFTVTGLLPLIEGIPAICHPVPTDVLAIAEGINQYKGTLFFGTSTFFRLFNKNQHIKPAMLASLRLVIAGAEKLSPEVRDEFKRKFNQTIYEGYGVTETSPATHVNLPDYPAKNGSMQQGSKLGTVGLPLPGTNVRIADPDTMARLAINEDGLILISGVQVMQGYLNDPDKTANVMVNMDGKRWYKTGDKGHVDEDGFLVIVDRYSRFVKIGGEMISLSMVEANINSTLPQGVEILATAIPCTKKGEKIILLYAGDITDTELKKCIAQSTLTKLMMPSALITLETIPKLGSGKTDFASAKKIALAGAK